MKFQPAFLILLLVLLNSCIKETPLVFTSESITEESNSNCVTTDCPEITINYINATGNTPVSDKINSRITSFIVAALTSGEESIPNSKSLVDGVSEFIKTYHTDKAEFPDMSARYVAEINASELSNTKDLISLELRQYLYTGGAHGNENISFLNIDPISGLEVPTESLVTNLKDFVFFIEKKFRQKYNIPLNDSINSSGFWFDDDTFYLPKTIGFTSNSVLVIYNQYEIASYADGLIELEILVEDVSEFLMVK